MSAKDSLIQLLIAGDHRFLVIMIRMDDFICSEYILINIYRD